RAASSSSLRVKIGHRIVASEQTEREHSHRWFCSINVRFGSKADIRTAKSHVRFTLECVAKLFAALRARNNRILVDGGTDQRCAFSSDVESMFRQQPLQIVLQHITP